ncbi:MAG: diacylglycerol kinase family lipid kinase [Clostridiales bacterium]|nr:diacylglycerol kinase family lipid kinase [Clostridiales bacterium]MBR6487401.1 diacylglycerol kinase family lipid kinase [Clostridiales bacterium]
MGLRLKIILNPSSGRETARSNIENVLSYLAMKGSIERADINYTAKRFDAMNFAMDTDPDEYDILIAAGGDGTVNEVVTGLMRAEIDMPVAIYNSGTVNDFATINRLPSAPQDFARMLEDPELVRVDCGKAGESYFMNVLAAGSFADVIYNVQPDLKTAFGPVAYWISAMKDIPSLNNSEHIIIHNGDETIETDAVMFFVSNTSSVGGFRNLMSQADVTDGLLDVMILKKIEKTEIMPLFGKILVGDHINSEKVIYFQATDFSIEAPDAENKITLDLDGEKGPSLPIRISCVPRAINLVTPRKDNQI